MLEPHPVITDYVVAVDAYAHRNERSTRPIVEFDPPRQIHGDVWIAQVDHKFCEAVLDACEPPGENFKPIRQGGCAYALCRKNAPDVLEFDKDSVLFHCVALSRIVHPTSIGFGAAARVRQYSSGVREIIPFVRGVTPLNPYAFVMNPEDDWLIPDDLPVLRSLLDALIKAMPLSRRVESALWHHEVAARHYYIDLRWPLLTACLETLIKIKNERRTSGRQWATSTKIFVDRLLAIGELDGTLAIGKAELEEMYERRSLFSHGLAYGNLDEHDRALYTSQERLARGILRKILLDTDFRDIFASDANIASRLPLR